MIYKYCRRCGRRLIGAENRLRGYGETCYAKAQREAQARPLIVPKNSTQEKTKAPATEVQAHTGTHSQRTQGTEHRESKAEGTEQGTRQGTEQGKA